MISYGDCVNELVCCSYKIRVSSSLFAQEIEEDSIRCCHCRLAALSSYRGGYIIQFDGRNGQRNGILDCCSLCLLDLLDLNAFSRMNMFGFIPQLARNGYGFTGNDLICGEQNVVIEEE